jgi:hypothetical protein
MDLRDFFAAHLAAALAHRVDRPAAIAARAYELADALLVERARGLVSYGQPISEEDVESFFAEQAPVLSDYSASEAFYRPEGLLDEPAPIEESDEELDAAYLEPSYDPRWEVEPRWEEPPRSERPGLARTTPVVPEAKKRQA